MAKLFLIGFFTTFLWNTHRAAAKGPSDFNAVKPDSAKTEVEKLLERNEYCASAKEFITAHRFLQKEKDFPLSTQTTLELSLKISKGCNGAAKRFEKIYSIFKATGIDIKKSIEAGIKFSTLNDAQVENFIEIFPQVYMKEFFDLDFIFALSISTRLAEISNGPIKQIRNDFTEITRFCLSEKNLNLPLSTCAELAVFLAEQSQYFPSGLSKIFIEEYNFLRNNPLIKLPIVQALEVLKEVFSYGPLAPANFREGLEYAFSSAGLNTQPKHGISLALSMAKSSTRNFPPPVIEETNTQK